jgi:hypothetical protein
MPEYDARLVFGRRFTTALPALDIRWLPRSLTASLPVEVTRTAQPLGGQGAWWVCPTCEQRVRIIYRDGESWRCRRCADLQYPPEYRCFSTRQVYRARRLRARLGDGGGVYGPLPSRPRGMRRDTYQRLVAELKQAEVLSWASPQRSLWPRLYSRGKSARSPEP